MTPKLIAAIALATLGVWLSAATASPIGLFAIPLIVLVVFDLFSQAPEPNITFERTITPQRAILGEEVLVELKVMNRGGGLPRFELVDKPPEHCSVAKGSTTLLCTLKSGESTTLRYTIKCDRVGVYDFGYVDYKASSTLGFTEKREEVPVRGELRVYPLLIHRRLGSSWVKTLNWAGLSVSRRPGGRSEYLEVRPYSAGDPLDSVNWKAYARTLRPQVNVWSSERGLDCVLVVDMYTGDVPKVGEWSAHNQLACCAYELASTLIRDGNRVGLVVLGSVLLKIPPSYGGRQLKRIVEAIVNVSDGSSWGAGSVEWVLQVFFAEEYRERRGVLFFVAAALSQELLDTIRELSAKGFKTNLVYVDTLVEEHSELKRLKIEKPAKLDVGLRVAQAEKQLVYGGCPSTVIEWTPREGFRVVREW
ncbi:MAG: DUF58 domain-containing protein [Thermoprotei archaeon]